MAKNCWGGGKIKNIKWPKNVGVEEKLKKTLKRVFIEK